MMSNIVRASVLFACIFISITEANISLGSCSLSCNENEQSANNIIGHGSRLRDVGPPGKMGRPGDIGLPGPSGERGLPGAECDCPDNEILVNRLNQLEEAMEELKEHTFIRDCSALKRSVNTSGLAIIFPFKRNTNGIHVYCDQDTDGGGWIVIQRRVDGSEDFYRGWDDYVRGFGDKEREMWLGLESIHLLTSNGSYELRVDLEDSDGNKAFAKYQSFSLTGADDEYRIEVSGYSGNAGDSLALHNGNQFSTRDNDNDKVPGDCATHYTGAWWYNNCHNSNLNGKYNAPESGARGVTWLLWKSKHVSLKRAEMKIRKIN